MEVYGCFAYLILFLLQQVVPCTSLCDGDKDTVCQIDEGVAVGIVIGCMVALLLIGFVVLLSCSYLKMPRDNDFNVGNQDVVAVSHVSTGQSHAISQLSTHNLVSNNVPAYTCRRDETGSTVITINNNTDQTDSSSSSQYLGVYIAQQHGGRET